MDPSASVGKQGVKGAVLFDFDMTLVDSSIGITYCLNRLALFFGLAEVSREEVVRTIGYPMVHAMEMLWGHFDPEWIDHYREHLVPLEYERMDAFPGTRETLSRLREEGLALGVVSNRKRLVPAVESSGLKEFFLSVVGLEDVKNPKPDPAPVTLSLKILGSEAGEAFLVGDSEIDAEAARRSGVRFIGVTSGGRNREILLREGAWAVTDGIPGLTGILL
ncbi:MAG: HAD-IA family hydrolase [Thermovirgaceae bacterium]